MIDEYLSVYFTNFPSNLHTKQLLRQQSGRATWVCLNLLWLSIRQLWCGLLRDLRLDLETQATLYDKLETGCAAGFRILFLNNWSGQTRWTETRKQRQTTKLKQCRSTDLKPHNLLKVRALQTQLLTTMMHMLVWDSYR